jgi:hypothetical protein
MYVGADRKQSRGSDLHRRGHFGFIDAEARPGWTLTTKARTLWFKVLQTCDQGGTDWPQIPDGSGTKPADPAARLEVLPTAAVPSLR